MLAAYWLTGSIPRFAKIFTDFGADLPGGAAMVVSMPAFVWWLIPVVVGAISIGKIFCTNDVPVSLFIDVCLLFAVFVLYELARLVLEAAYLKLITDLT